MNLNWSLFTKNLKPHAQLRLKLQQKVNKIAKHLEHFSEDAVHLKVNLERHPKKYWFSASLTLKLPTGPLRAAKFGEDPLPAFDQAVAALLRELNTRKSDLRHEKEWRRPATAKTPLAAAVVTSSPRQSTRASAQPTA